MSPGKTTSVPITLWPHPCLTCCSHCPHSGVPWLPKLTLLQRKTRCDATLPRCLPCERSGSVCEYFDTAKNKKINRHYVVRLQDRVRQLEAELAQFTDEDNEYPRTHEDMVRPGGLVKLSRNDETPRYLGPSSGIAMTRLLMEEAKRYTESNRIADLVPELRARRLDPSDRMQSIIGPGRSISGPAGRQKSYAPFSDGPTAELPKPDVINLLVRVFKEKCTFQCSQSAIELGMLNQRKLTFSDRPSLHPNTS